MEDSAVDWIVLVTRHYHWLVKPYTVLWGKYVGTPLTFFSDRPIDDLPDPHRCVVTFPFNHALYRQPSGREFKDGLRKINAPIVALLLIDEIPQNRMDHGKLSVLVDFMLREGNIARGSLDRFADSIVQQIATSEPGSVRLDDGIKIVRVRPDHKGIGQLGASSLKMAVWSRKFLLEFVEDGWTFDAIELPGQHKFIRQYPAWESVCPLPSLISVAHLCYTRAQDVVEAKWLKEEDRSVVVEAIPPNFKMV